MGGISQVILGLLGTILYPFFSIIFIIMDTVQNIFFGFAGLGKVIVGYEYVDNEGLMQEKPIYDDNRSGIVYYLLRSDIAWNILLSMVILALFLLIIFTVMAFIKNMYAAKQKRWQEIISNSVKGLINFLFLPVCCLIGVVAGNVLLKALNEATSDSQGTSIARQLFVASAYTGNIFRDSAESGGLTEIERGQAWIRLKGYYSIRGLDTSWAGESYDSSKRDVYALKLDEIYKMEDGPNIYVSIGGVSNITLDYRAWEINYLLLCAGGIFILFVLIKICFGAVKRLFMLTVLFVISPAVCSLYPLDDGSAVNKWRGEFIKWFFSVYGAVVGMNLYFDLVPLINSIKFYSGEAVDILGLVPLLITIAGLYMTSDFINLITSFISGSGNVLSEGSSLAGQVKGGIKKTMKNTATAGVAVTGAFYMAHKSKQARKEFLNQKGQEAGDKAVAEFEEGTNKNGYKGTKEDYEHEKEQIRTRAAEEAIGRGGIRGKLRNTDEQKEVRKAAGTGWWGSMGRSVLGGLDNISGATGFGKWADIKKKVKEQGEGAAAKTKAEQKIASEGEYGEKKMVAALASGDIDKLVEALTTMERAGDPGKQAFKIMLKDEKVQDSIKSLGYDPKKLTFDQFSNNVRQLKRDSDLQERERQSAERVEKLIVQQVNQMVADGKAGIGGNNAANIEAMKEYLRSGGSAEAKDVFADGKTKADKQKQKEMFAEMDNFLKTNREFNAASSNSKVINAQRLEVLKDIDTTGMSGEASQAVVDALGEVQSAIDRLDNGEKLVRLNVDTTTGLGKLKESFVDIGRKMVEAINKEKETLTAELKKQNKDKKS